MSFWKKEKRKKWLGLYKTNWLLQKNRPKYGFRTIFFAVFFTFVTSSPPSQTSMVSLRTLFKITIKKPPIKGGFFMV